MKIQVWLKSGNTFTVECEEVRVNTNTLTNTITGYAFIDTKPVNRPIYINYDSIEAVTRVEA